MTEADFHRLSAFNCGVEELNHFFRHEVKECVSRHYLAAYCAYLPSGEIIAAFTLMNDALMIPSNTEKAEFIDDLKYETTEDCINFFNRQTSYPAINIGHLGVSKPYQKKGIGTAIIDLVSVTFANYKQAGCQFVTVDAINQNNTLLFYVSNLFHFQTIRDSYSSTRRMYRII